MLLTMNVCDTAADLLNGSWPAGQSEADSIPKFRFGKGIDLGPYFNGAAYNKRTARLDRYRAVRMRESNKPETCR